MVSMLAALYLLSMLLIWVVPHLFVDQSVRDGADVLVRYGLPLPAAGDHPAPRRSAADGRAPIARGPLLQRDPVPAGRRRWCSAASS